MADNATAKAMNDNSSAQENGRRYTRFDTETMLLLKLSPEHPDLFARIDNWSAAGLCIIVEDHIKLPKTLNIRKLKRFELSEPVLCEVVWRTGEQVGLKFLPPEH